MICPNCGFDNVPGGEECAQCRQDLTHLDRPQPLDRFEQRLLADTIRVLWEATDRYRSLYFATPAHRRRVNAEHRAIMAAVARGDSAAAVELSREHRTHTLRALCDALPGSHDEMAAPATKATARATRRD